MTRTENENTMGIRENNIALLVQTDRENWQDKLHMVTIIGRPIIKFKIFVASRGSTPIKSSGTNSQENSGPQYPLTASWKFPAKYFWAMEM